MNQERAQKLLTLAQAARELAAIKATPGMEGMQEEVVQRIFREMKVELSLAPGNDTEMTPATRARARLKDVDPSMLDTADLAPNRGMV